MSSKPEPGSGSSAAQRPRLVTLTTPDWRDRLTLFGKPPRPTANLDNCLTALESAPEWENVLAWDEFKGRVLLRRRTPWGGNPNRPWTDQDDRLAARWFQRQDINVGVNTAKDAIETHAQTNSFNPLLDWLGGLEWDGYSRVDTWLRDYFGVKWDDYSCAVGRKWLVSAVARVYEPGCKADNCIVLEGREGLRKSTALQILAGADYFIDHLPKDYNKEAPIALQGVWIVEFGDLEGISHSADKVDAVKNFLSRTKDHYRPVHGRRTIDAPRRCVWAATTNREVYLPGETGNRRFWPVKCERAEIDHLRRDREQLWAEAVSLYLGGEQWHLDKDTERLAKLEQIARYEEDPWHEPVARYLERKADVAVVEILEKALQKSATDLTTRDQQRVVRCLKALGWEQYRVSKTGARRYRRG